jgi:RHS repeat-associated protein
VGKQVALLTQTFDPYGSLLARGGTGASSFGFTGEQVDANGLVYLRARYYAPGMGRFFQMDPSRQEVNPYQYGFSNPLYYTDPSGLCPPLAPIIVAILILLGVTGCAAPPPSSEQIAARNASVMIEVCNDGSCNTSLGTVVNEGIVTHTHFVGEGPGGIYYKDNPDESIDFLVESDSVILYGANSETELSGESLHELETLRIWQGSMLLELPSDISPSNIGTPVSMLVDTIPPDNSEVLYTYIKGEDNTCVGWNCIKVDRAVFSDDEFSFGETSFVPTYPLVDFEGELPSFGDSGGGIFLNGELIGTYQGVQFDEEKYLWALLNDECQ